MLLSWKEPEELPKGLEVQVGSAVPPIIVDHSDSVVSAYQQNICATGERKIVRKRNDAHSGQPNGQEGMTRASKRARI